MTSFVLIIFLSKLARTGHPLSYGALQEEQFFPPTLLFSLVKIP